MHTLLRLTVPALALLLTATVPGLAQIPACATGISFPNPAIDRDPVIYNTAADLRLAVGDTRIVLTSNDKVQLRCRGTGGKLTGTTTLPLRGATLATGLFVTNPATDDAEVKRRHFDPRVIWDNHSDRFWIVASEDGAAAAQQVGRLHIATSKTATPNSWSGTQWTKCTFGAGADKAPIDIQAFGPGNIADRPSIAVDAQFVYICYRESDDANGGDDYSVILVIAKAQFTSPGTIVPNAVLHVDLGMILELAVDYDIDPNAEPGVYAVSRGMFNEVTGRFEKLRVGRVSLTNGVWGYNGADYALGSHEYVGACLTAPGGEYQSGAQCQNTLLDTNNVNGHFWSAATRIHEGVRKIWAVHTVQPEGVQCQEPQVLQWYEIPAANPANFIAERYALPDDGWATDSSIGVNDNGDIVIYFSWCSENPSFYPGIGRLVKPRGQSATVTLEKPGPDGVVYRGKNYGQGSGNVGWCDFSGTEPDPVDRCQFWSHHMTAFATPDECGSITQKWQSYLLRTRLSCDAVALRGNLDMNEDGELTADDIAIYSERASAGEPEMDRTYEGETDVWDFLDFMHEWDNPE